MHFLKLLQNRSVLPARSLIRLLLFCLPSLSPVTAQPASVQIRTLNTEEGLSSHNIICLAQDDMGFLWAGTDDGVNRYDGTEFKTYRNEPADTTTLSDSRVTVLLPVKYHGMAVLWVGTRNGLNRIDMTTGLSKMYLPDPENKHTLSHATITALATDSEGVLWVGTEDGLNYLTRGGQTNGLFRQINLAQDDAAGRPENFIRSLALGTGIGSNRDIWVGTRNGLKHIQLSGQTEYRVTGHDFYSTGVTPNENEIRALRVSETHDHIELYIGTDAGSLYSMDLLAIDSPARKLWFFNNYIRDIEVDNSHQLWVATYGGGLIKLSEDLQGKFSTRVFLGSPQLKNSLSNSHTVDLLYDMSGILWVATDNGLNALVEPVLDFRTMTHIPDEPRSLVGSEIRSVATDSRGNLWVGTVASGLTVIRGRKRDQFQHFYHDPELPNSLTSNSITSILEDRHGTIWLGTWDGGLLKLNGDERSFTVFTHDPQNPNSPPNNVIQGILEDREGYLWLNTGNGLSRFDPDLESFTNYQHDPLDSTTVSQGDLQSKAMYLDRRNRLWVGSYGGGLNRLDLNEPMNRDPRTANFSHFHNEISNISSLSNDMIISLHGSWDGSQEVLWAGTFNGGLNRISFVEQDGVETIRIKRFTEDQGLCDNVVFGIEEDRLHNLWLSTGGGLARFDPLKENFTNYFIEDGLPSNSFFWGASHCSASGEMFFGGTDGLVHFQPETITSRQPVIPKIAITGMTTAQGPLTDRPQQINLTRQFFDYDQLPFTIEWALFDFVNPVRNKYWYRIDELHENWISAGPKTSATFSNLKGGTYTLRVRGANHNGVAARAEGILSFAIKPPFRQTTIFKLLAVVSLAALVYLFIVLRTQVMKSANKQLRELNEDLKTLVREKEEAEAVVSAALREKEVLLREIYHRTKNNMSVILSLLDLQAAKLHEPRLNEIFEEIKGRIYAMSLVHEQLMRTRDLSVINLNTYIHQLLDNLFLSYHDLNDRVLRVIAVELIDVSIDTAVPLGLVLNEIVTNSLKYAFPDGRQGELRIEGRMQGDKLHLSVSDNGVGFTLIEGFNERKSLGLSIIHNIVEDQLAGTLTVDTEGGTRYSMVIADVNIVRRV